MISFCYRIITNVDLANFSFHLSGISSMLGAMDFISATLNLV